MSHAPRVLVCHERAHDYRDALLERMPGSAIATRSPDQLGRVAAAAQAGELDNAAAARLADVEALLAWRIPEGVLRSLPGLRWIQVAGAGVDHFLDRDDLPAGVLLTRSLGRFGIQVTEYVIGYLLHYLLDIEGHREHQRRRVWKRHGRPLLADLTVGIVGLGSLGMPLAHRLRAFGARVLAVRRSGTSIEGVDRVYGPRNWKQMLPECEALVLTAPRTSETERMVDAVALAALPAGAILVNVARGNLVDEEALVTALADGRLGAAILDVFATEPLPENHPLWSQERAWLTPHVAAPSEIGPMADEFAANYARFTAGERLLNLVDRQRGY